MTFCTDPGTEHGSPRRSPGDSGCVRVICWAWWDVPSGSGHCHHFAARGVSRVWSAVSWGPRGPTPLYAHRPCLVRSGGRCLPPAVPGAGGCAGPVPQEERSWLCSACGLDCRFLPEVVLSGVSRSGLTDGLSVTSTSTSTSERRRNRRLMLCFSGNSGCFYCEDEIIVIA